MGFNFYLFIFSLFNLCFLGIAVFGILYNTLDLLSCKLCLVIVVMGLFSFQLLSRKWGTFALMGGLDLSDVSVTLYCFRFASISSLLSSFTTRFSTEVG